MRYLILLIFATTSLTLFGQSNKLSIHSKELVYAVNPKDTNQKILLHIYTQDICGNETSYSTFDYTDYLSFESQKESALVLKDKGYREYNYGTNCKPTLVSVLDKNKDLLQQFLYKYNADNTLDQLTILNSKNTQTSRYKYQYNRNRKLIKELRYDQNNKADHITIYKYNNDTISYETRINLSDKDTLVCHYTYNHQKQLIVEEWSNINGDEKEFEISIYMNSLKVKELFLDEDDKAREYKTTYYDNGLEKTWKQVDPITGEILEYELHEYELLK